MTNVTILGPNLKDQSKGGVHVHAAGCRDLRSPKYRNAESWTADFETRRAIVEDVYPPDQFEYWHENDGQEYFDDVWFAPCLKSLP